MWILRMFLLVAFSMQILIFATHVLTKPVNDSQLSVKRVTKKWMHIDQKIRNATESIFEILIPAFTDSVTNLNIRTRCMKEILQVVKDLRRLKPWAVRFVDASGFMIDGLLTGAHMSFGSYDECLDIHVPSKENPKKLLFRGQYCTIDLLFHIPSKDEWGEFEKSFRKLFNGNSGLKQQFKYFKRLKYLENIYSPSFRFGMCVPSGCTLHDVDKIAKTVAKNIMINVKAKRCELKEKVNFSSGQIIVICCISAVGLLVLIGSLLDVCSYYKKNLNKFPLNNVVLAFSSVRNVKILLGTKHSDPKLRFLNGVRFITMSWVICVHSYLNLNFRTLGGIISYVEAFKSFPFLIISNASFSTDTFFLLGGFLVSSGMIKLVKHHNRPFNFLLYIAVRIFRISPSYIFILLLLILRNAFGTGPVWHEFGMMSGNLECQNTWWRNLLFINNYFPHERKCLAHTWYLDVDFQLYAMAPIFILPLIRWPRSAVMVIIAGIITTVISSAIIAYVYNLSLVLMSGFITAENIDALITHYNSPLTHAGPYWIGVLLGYVFVTNPNLKIPLKTQLFGWPLAIICNSSVIYGLRSWISKEELPPLAFRILYHSLSRIFWAMGVAWVLICCATGHGGIVNKILCWKPFAPLGRLTFFAYMIHPIIIIMYQGSLRTSTMFTHLAIVWYFFAYLIVTYIAAFAGSMLIEYPFNNLGKMLIERVRGKSKKILRVLI